ncbi:MAG: hypothetical protein ABJF11_00455 [Reichenbachiella sp.]|uniref:hypothetical protein n=1 Tax=Reichenbachiella sp. TaxID=2184521 RepID=UPI0032647A93
MAAKDEVCIGMWLDQQEALIIRADDENPIMTKLPSKIENFHPTGGARSKTLWGPRDVISEKAYLNRKKQQSKEFYDSILSEIGEATDLLILGPAEAKTGLLKMIKSSKNLTLNSLNSESCDKLTDNQLIAKINKYFKSKRSNN